jgi:hypothetical protein
MNSQTSNQPAQDQVGRDYDNERDDNRLAEIHEVQDDDLVNEVESQCDKDHLAHTFLPGLDHVGPMIGIGNEAP